MSKFQNNFFLNKMKLLQVFTKKLYLKYIWRFVVELVESTVDRAKCPTKLVKEKQSS